LATFKKVSVKMETIFPPVSIIGWSTESTFFSSRFPFHIGAKIYSLLLNTKNVFVVSERYSFLDRAALVLKWLNGNL